MICRKWPVSEIRYLVRDRVFCDRDHVIVDRELQGPSKLLYFYEIKQYLYGEKPNIKQTGLRNTAEVFFFPEPF